MKTGALERKSVVESFRATETRRHALAATYREEFLTDLAAARGANRTAAELSFVEIAVSARLQVAELTARFSRGRATDRDQVALADARAQLARTIRALGLAATATEPADVDPDDGPPRGATLAERQEWCRRYVQARPAEAKAAR